MKILAVLKRYNKVFAILAFVTIIAIYLVISLSGNYLKDVLYRDDNIAQPVNNIKSIEETPKPIDNDSQGKNNNSNGKPQDESNEFFEYVFTEDQNLGDYIYLTNQFPISDEIGKKLEGKYKTYNFKLRFNEASVGVKYNITLEKLAESDLMNDWVKVYLVNEGKDIPNCIRSNGRIKTFNEYPLYNGKNDEIILYSGTVTPEEANRGYKNYTLRMWISEDVHVVNQDYEERSIVARVNVYANK